MGIARVLKLTFCTVTLTLLGLAGAVPAAAEPWPDDHQREGSVTVTPISPRPGEEVTIEARGCKGRHATAHSEAFVAEAKLAPRGGGVLSGEAMIRSRIEPGVYPVEVHCEGRRGELSGRVVISGLVPDKPDHHGEHPKPTAPVRAGGGAMAVEESGGAGTWSAAGPVVLAGVALGTVLLAVRRARRAREH
ncbi:hypothetical protein [Streptomyces sodiiphilus]